MIGKLSPGQRARLAALGVSPDDLGRAFNRAGAPANARPRQVELPSNLPVPKSSDELAEFMADPRRMRDAMTDRDTWYSFIAEYGRQQQGDGTELQRTVAAETQKALIDFLKENEVDGIKRLNLDPQTTPTSTFRTARDMVARHNPAAPGAAYDGEFTSSGDFFSHVFWRNRQNVAAIRDKMERITNSYGSNTPSDGGFLIPEVLRSQLLQVAMESAVVRPRAFNVPMESLRVDLPMIDVTTNNGSVLGGMVAYWIEEGAPFTDSSAKFGVVRLEAKNLTGYSVVPNQLLADSIISFSAFIETQWPKAISWFEDLAFLRGTGVGQPLGMIGAQNPATTVVSKEGGQGAATILWQNVIKMFARMFPSSLNQAVWLVSPDTFPELATMALNVGTGGSAVWLNNGVSGPPMTILGRPVIVTEKVPTLGTRGDIAFVDMSYYLIGDRQSMSAASSEHIKFNENKTAFRIIERVDGTPWLQSAITPANGGNALSAFVELETR